MLRATVGAGQARREPCFASAPRVAPGAAEHGGRPAKRRDRSSRSRGCCATRRDPGVASDRGPLLRSSPLPLDADPHDPARQSQPPRRPPRRRVVGRVQRHGPAFRRRPPRPDL